MILYRKREGQFWVERQTRANWAQRVSAENVLHQKQHICVLSPDVQRCNYGNYYFERKSTNSTVGTISSVRIRTGAQDILRLFESKCARKIISCLFSSTVETGAAASCRELARVFMVTSSRGYLLRQQQGTY